MASTYLNRTVASASNRKTWTYSAWIKRSGIGNTQTLLVSWSDGNNHSKIRLESDKVHVYDLTSGSFSYQVKTNRMLRDTSAWYHIVVAFDTTQSTASNRLKIYVNGEQETSLAESSYPAEDYEGFINRNRVHSIGYNANNSNYFDGYMSHVALVDGTALTPTSFGETDSTSGIWKFKSPSGVTWGTNGFHLKFENSGALGTDSSGNTNTFTVNGNLKQALDTPSNVHCTMNPLTTTHHTFSNANLSINGSDSKTSVGSLGVNTGKWYWEAKITGSTSLGQYAGATTIENENHWDNAPTSGAADVRTWAGNGNYHNYTQSGNTADSDIISTTGTVYGYALDLDNGTMKYFVNGTLTHTDSTIPSDNSKTFFPVSGTTNSGGGGWQGADYNFGSGNFGTTAITSAGSNGNGSLFEYDVPSGYYALNTKNINTYG